MICVTMRSIYLIAILNGLCSGKRFAFSVDMIISFN